MPELLLAAVAVWAALKIVFAMNPSMQARVPPSPVRASWAARIAAILLPLAVTVVAWWGIGDQSTTTGPNPDYDIRPLPMSVAEVRTLGISAFLLACITGVVITREMLKGRFDRRWRVVLLSMAISGAIVGTGYRVMTAAVIGANIGSGLFVMFFGPILLLLLLIAVIRTRVIMKLHRASPECPEPSSEEGLVH